MLDHASHSSHLSPLQRRLWYHLYNIFITLLWPVLFFYYFLRVHTDGKYRDNYPARLGMRPPFLPHGPRRVWVHALSVGETLSVVPLVQAIKRERPDLEILFSAATETGLKMGRARLGPTVNAFFTLPHDFPWSMHSLVDHLKPDLFVLVETDIWPNLLHALKRRGVLTVLVNGRISQKSFHRLKSLAPFVRVLFRCFDFIFAQSLDDKFRYEVLGVAPEQVHAAGNLKFDSVLRNHSEEDLSFLRRSSGIDGQRLTWIAGSTHEGEEEILLEIHARLRVRYPDLLLVLAPRHIERIPHLLVLCRKHGLEASLRSRGESARERQVYLLDTLGELSIFYALADVAFIGGSLVPFGGHNPLEAVACGKPTLWGAHLSNFREMEASLVRAGCGQKVFSLKELETALDAWLMDRGARDRVKAAAMDFCAAHTGSSSYIARWLAKRI